MSRAKNPLRTNASTVASTSGVETSTLPGSTTDLPVSPVVPDETQVTGLLDAEGNLIEALIDPATFVVSSEAAVTPVINPDPAASTTLAFPNTPEPERAVVLPVLSTIDPVTAATPMQADASTTFRDTAVAEAYAHSDAPRLEATLDTVFEGAVTALFGEEPHLRVTCSVEGGRRRAGRRWPQGETIIPAADLSLLERAQLVGDPRFTLTAIKD